MSADEIAKAFTQHYYNQFDTSPDGLAGLFTDASMMTFEGGPLVVGGAAIVAKIKSFGQVGHQVKNIDVQPSQSPNAICIFVTGAVTLGSPNPIHFCEFIQLVSTGNNNYHIHNCIFRLNYGL
ncbi:MAG: hypothetical protein SGILL_007430 [Bacillariaceae sp.]